MMSLKRIYKKRSLSFNSSKSTVHLAVHALAEDKHVRQQAIFSPNVVLSGDNRTMVAVDVEGHCNNIDVICEVDGIDCWARLSAPVIVSHSSPLAMSPY